MPFPFSFRYRHQEKTSLSTAEMQVRVEDELLRHKANEIVTKGEKTYFNAGMFRFVSNYNILAMVSSGWIGVEKKNDQIEIVLFARFTQALVVVSVMVFGILGTFVIFAINPNFLQRVTILVAAWLWLFGVNYLITILRLRSWIKAILRANTADVITVPWWKFRDSFSSVIGKPLKPFQPVWQPSWLLKIRWRWKLPLMVYAVAIVWNGLMFKIFGFDTFFEIFSKIKNFRGIFSAIIVLNMALLIVAPYLVGRSIERWNEKVVARMKRDDL